MKQQKKRRDEEMDIITDYMVLEIEEGQIYSDKNILKTAIRFYAMIKNFQIRTNRSELREYMVTCVDENCNWFLGASKLKQIQTFKIRKYVNNHNCSLDVIMEDHMQATYNTIAQIVRNKYDSINRLHAPNDIMKDMLHEFWVFMGYQKAWRTRENALELSRGKLEDSYKQLPMYLHMLKKENLGTVTELFIDKKNRFKYMFLALSNSIRGWIHCRPVIAVDDTFLKTTYGRTLFTVSTMDANNHIFILVFGIGDSENDSSWEWFSNKLRETFEER
ncbi:uncharacterized protein LOC133034123 [Cannabis sativa]|uniref:uncharacterized protein LOC133034123 n=1 Tax=Cannabis sativa TaxID=3483 RepID=UPI0029CAA8FA|nr:uncharacterized protein LOC133034123 [Cannabis sativa]